MLKAKTSLAWFAAVVFICSGVARAQDQPLPKAPSDAEYRICTGDVLQISVYQHPELSRAVVVAHEAPKVVLCPPELRLKIIPAAGKLN